jgi:hypothetical protein
VTNSNKLEKQREREAAALTTRALHTHTHDERECSPERGLYWRKGRWWRWAESASRGAEFHIKIF